MKKLNLILLFLLITSSASAIFKPSKPDLVADDILVPEKLFEVKTFGVKQLADVKYAKTNKKIKGAEKKVVVPFYTITFPKKHKLGKSNYEKKRGINIETNISGISEQAYKDLTNWGYENLLEKLKTAGFEVVEKNKLTTNEVYQGMKSKKQKNKKGYSQYFPTDMKAGGQFSTGMATPKLMDSFQTDVLGVNLSLDPMARQRDQSKFVSKKTKVGQAVYVSHLDAYINSMKNSKCYRGRCSSKAVGSISFINPIHSDIVFGHVEDNTNTKANVAGHAVTTLLRLGGAGAKTSYTFKYILNADEEKYIAAAQDALAKTNEKLVNELTGIY